MSASSNSTNPLGWAVFGLGCTEQFCSPSPMKHRAVWLGVGVSLLLVGFGLWWREHSVNTPLLPSPRLLALLDNSPGNTWLVDEHFLDERVLVADVELLERADFQWLRREIQRYRWASVWELVGHLIPLRSAELQLRGQRLSNRVVGCLWILGRAGLMARSAESEIRAMASDSRFSDRLTAVAALARIQGADPRSLSTLVPWMKNATLLQRIEIACTWARMSPVPPEGLAAIFKEGLQDDKPVERAKILEQFHLFGPWAHSLTPELKRLVAKLSGVERAYAAFALGVVSPEDAETAVAVMLDVQKASGVDRYTSLLYYNFYARMGPKAVEAVPSLLSDFSSGQLGADGQLAIAYALWKIQHSIIPGTVDLLVNDLENSTHPVQLYVLEVVAEIGPRASAAAPALERLSTQPWRSQLVRSKASAALAAVAP